MVDVPKCIHCPVLLSSTPMWSLNWFLLYLFGKTKYHQVELYEPPKHNLFPLSLLLLLWTIELLNINLNRHLPHISAQCNSRIYSSSSSAVGCYRIPKIIIIIVPHLSHQLLLHLNEWMITRMRIWSCCVCVAENTVSELMHRLPTSPNVITRRRRLCVDGRPSLLVIHAVDCHSPDHHPPFPSPSCSLTQLSRTLSLSLPLRLFS